MAYKVKYRLDYCNKEKLNARLDFEIKDYTSTTIYDIVGTQDAFSYKVRNEKSDRSGYFRTLEADINIFEDDNFNIDNLLTSDETKIRVKFYIEGQIEFVGFIIPDFFEVSIDKPRVISMVASDRIGTLKNQTLPRETGIQSFKYMIEQSLLKTGLDLTLNSTINFNPIGQSGDFLTNTGGLMERLSSDKGASISCYDIIKSILIVSNSFLLQEKGQWHILNKLEYESRPKTKDIEQINVGGRRLINPPSSKVGVMAEFGGGLKYPANYNFQSLTGWTAKNGFVAQLNTKQIDGFNNGNPIYGSTISTNNLLNRNSVQPTTKPDEQPYLESPAIRVVSVNPLKARIKTEVNVTTDGSIVYYMIYAKNGNQTKILGADGFYDGNTGDRGSNLALAFRVGDRDDQSQAYTGSNIIEGVLEDEINVTNWNIYIRIYGTASTITTFVNFAYVEFPSENENKGNLFKIEQGVNFTKESEIDTTIFGDYINKGINGYFYNYQRDETNSIFYKIGASWEQFGLGWQDQTQTPLTADRLLLHSVRQRAIMFSDAHNIITAVIKGKFSPLDIYDVCGIKYVLVEAEYDFYRNETELRIEEVKYDNSVLKTDYVYSYFGGEDTTSISGVSGVSSGGSSGGGGAPCLIKIDDDGNYYVEENFYSLKDVSAFGKDKLGGGAGGGTDLVSWVDQIMTLTDFNVGSNFINIQQVEAKNYATNTRVDGINSRLTSVEGGSVMTVVTSGSGNAITSISKSGTVITATKGDTFSKVGHSHVISDITNLQTQLNSKASNTTVNGINGRLTTVESNYTTQSDIDNAIDGIEIGGRNLIIQNRLQNGYIISQTGKATGHGPDQHDPNYYECSEGDDFVSKIYDLGELPRGGAGYMAFYDDSKVFISSKAMITNTVGEVIKVKAPTNAKYYRYATTSKTIKAKLEKGTKPTDWTPAPEDQVSDWNSTNSNSFDFIKNKPTKLSQFSNVETDFTSKTYVTTELNKKVDKVAGKSLISDSEISRLSTVVNQTATSIGLGNVTNESKAVMFASPTFTGTVSGVTKAMVGLSNVDNVKQATKSEFDTFVSAFNAMFEMDGDFIKAKHSLYSIGDLSAFGKDNIGGGTGSGASSLGQLDDVLLSTVSDNQILRYSSSDGFWKNTNLDLSAYATISGLNNKVDKVAGYSLVSDTEIARLSNVTNQDLSTYAKTQALLDRVKTPVPLNAKFTDTPTDISGKVDKVAGKSLISDTEITRLSSVTNQTKVSLGLDKVTNDKQATKSEFDNFVALRNNPHQVTKAQVGLGNVTNESKATMFTNPTFTGNLTAVNTEVDSLIVNDTSFMYGDLIMAGTTIYANDVVAYRLGLPDEFSINADGDRITFDSSSVTKQSFYSDGKIEASSFKGPKVDFGNGFTIEPSGTELVFKYNGVIKQRMLSDGTILATGDVTAFG